MVNTKLELPSPEVVERDPLDVKLIFKLVYRLIRLYHETHPAKGAASAEEKTHNAEMALLAASKLYWILAKWAFQHMLGVKFAGDYFRDRASKRRERFSPIAFEESLFGHSFEWIGSKYKYGANVEADQEVIQAVIRYNCLYDDQELYKLMLFSISQIEALNYGETGCIFAPSRVGKHANFHMITRERMKAICYVEFLRSQGIKKHEAINRVANAYGVAPETLRTWEKRTVPEAFPDLEWWLAGAGGAGEWEKRCQMGHASGVPKNPLVHGIHSLLTCKTLEEHGRDYREAQRAAAETG